MLIEESAAGLMPAHALVPAPGGAVLCDSQACRHAGIEEARRIFRSGDVLVAHTAFVSGRLRTPPAAPLFDVMELFAFARPAEPCVPSALGLARALGLAWPATPEDSARTLIAAAALLIEELAQRPEKARLQLRALAATLDRFGWRWAPAVLQSLGEGEAAPATGLEAWRGLPEWEDEPDPGKPGSDPVGEAEAKARLAAALGLDGEARPEQQAYVDAALYALAPRERAGAPKVALVEAGTGTGKTLAYLSAASLWAEKNGPGLWISTYTRNLQRQILQEISRLYPDPAERDEKACVRKGRENYLCLL
ncbi:MAG: ATP-dependent DNA helicase, partial [Alphaproteobacteria bacterium]|nr:ATP-dependent DNA helicase [Alphaproteobacteria bacterium]